MADRTATTRLLAQGIGSVATRAVARVPDPVRRKLAGRLQDASNRLAGAAYRLGGGEPDPAAPDAVLEQRIRSRLGGLQRELDVPRVHVTVADHVATLHGVVGTADQATTIRHAVERISGVATVRSRLAIGYGSGDSTPSEGRRRRAPSAAWRDLVGSVREIGVDGEETATRLTVTILQTFLGALPEGERAHVTGHLPVDVRERLEAAPIIGTPRRPRTVQGFDRAVTETAGVPARTARLATRSLLATLRDVVPEEVADVEAVLPAGLKELWREPTAVGG